MIDGRIFEYIGLTSHTMGWFLGILIGEYDKFSSIRGVLGSRDREEDSQCYLGRS